MINDTLTRRRFLAAGGATTLGLGAITALGTSVSLAAPGVPGDGDVLVLLDLSGAADGLSLTPPLQDSAYYDVRPTIAVRPPNQAGGSLPLSGNGRVSFSSGFDGAFGLHPAAKPIYDALWSTGKLAVVPGAGFKGSTLVTLRRRTITERVRCRSTPKVPGLVEWSVPKVSPPQCRPRVSPTFQAISAPLVQSRTSSPSVDPISAIRCTPPSPSFTPKATI